MTRAVFFDVDVEGDIVNTARPGDRAIMTGIVRAEQDFTLGQPRSRSFRSKIDSNYIEVVGKEPCRMKKGPPRRGPSGHRMLR